MTKWIDRLCVFTLKLVDGKQTLGCLDGWLDRSNLDALMDRKINRKGEWTNG